MLERDIIRDKQYRTYSSLSRYQNIPIYYNVDDNKYIYGTSSYLDDTTVSQEHTVKNGDTYDNLSLLYYGNPTYYWVICSFNRIQDPFDRPVVGTKLKIPTISTIKFMDI